MASSLSKNRFAVTFLSLTILLVLGRVVFNQFLLYDDPNYVIRNPQVLAGLTSSTVKWAFTSMEAANWHPLTWISHMLDVEVFGLSPWGHHLVSLLFHLGATLLLYRFLHLCTGAFWQSVVVAALFGVHPLHVESVAWVAERKDVLCGFLWMAGLLVYSHYCRKGGPGLYLAVLVLFTLGLMAKPMMVSFPLVLLLMDFWPLKRIEVISPTGSHPIPVRVRTSVILEKVPMVALAVGSCVITYIAQSKGGSVSGLDRIPLDARLLNGFISYLMYFWKLLVPTDLSVLYLYPSRVSFTFGLLGILSVSACIWASFKAIRSSPWLVVGLLWYLVTLVPVIGIVQVGAQSMADRYMYLPSVGVLISLVWGAGRLLERINLRSPLRELIVSLVFCGYALAAHHQAGYWKDTETLFGRALKLDPGNFVAHNMLGLALAEKGESEAALDHYRRSVHLNPNFADGLNNLGFELIRKGHLEEGTAWLEKVLEVNPGHLFAHGNLARAFQEKGEYEKAMEHVHYLLSRDQASPHAWNAAGLVLASQRRYGEAQQYFSKALELCPECPEAENNYGRYLMLAGRPDDAVGHLVRAIDLREGYPEAHNNLALCLLALGHPRDAIYHAARAIQLLPGYDKASRTLDRILDALCRESGGNLEGESTYSYTAGQ
jgi:tetratricopeptide (TPR) repeat protein